MANCREREENGAGPEQSQLWTSFHDERFNRLRGSVSVCFCSNLTDCSQAWRQTGTNSYMNALKAGHWPRISISLKERVMWLPGTGLVLHNTHVAKDTFVPLSLLLLLLFFVFLFRQLSFAPLFPLSDEALNAAQGSSSVPSPSRGEVDGTAA